MIYNTWQVNVLSKFQLPSSNSEFLKAAIMQSHDWAKYLKICTNFGLMNGEQEKLSLTLGIFHKGNRTIADLRYGLEDSIIPSTLIFAAIKS